MGLSAAVIQEIADTCHTYGYDFHIAITTAARDGQPWYIVRDQLN